MLQVYALAYELKVVDINQILDLPIEIYRGWIIWLNKRNKEAQRR